MPKSIAAAKSQNFVNIAVAQNTTWAKFLELKFFLSEKARLCRYHQNKKELGVTSSSYINLTMRLTYNEIVDKIVFISLKAGQN